MHKLIFRLCDPFYKRSDCPAEGLALKLTAEGGVTLLQKPENPPLSSYLHSEETDTQVASPGNKYFNFCFIFMMTNNFQVYFLLFFKYKAKPQTGTTETFYFTLTRSVGSSSNWLTTDQASVGRGGRLS